MTFVSTMLLLPDKKYISFFLQCLSFSPVYICVTYHSSGPSANIAWVIDFTFVGLLMSVTVIARWSVVISHIIFYLVSIFAWIWVAPLQNSRKSWPKVMNWPHCIYSKITKICRRNLTQILLMAIDTTMTHHCICHHDMPWLVLSGKLCS